MKNTSLLSAPKTPIALRDIEQLIASDHGLANYVDCALQEQEQFGSPEERIIGACGGNISPTELKALRAYLSKVVTH